MSVIVLTPALLEQIRREAEAAYPEEMCGILIGRDAPPQTACPEGVQVGDEDEGRRVVERALLAGNVHAAAERYHRFTIEPKALLAAEREAQANGQVVLGFYHSHPDHPAKPSATDLATAWPVYSYLIVQVDKGKARAVTSWRLQDGGTPAEGRFMEEIIGGT